MGEMSGYGSAVHEISDWLSNYREEGSGMGWLKPEQELVIADLQREFDRQFMFTYVDYTEQEGNQE